MTKAIKSLNKSPLVKKSKFTKAKLPKKTTTKSQTKMKTTTTTKNQTKKSAEQILLETMALLYQRGQKTPEKKKVLSLSKLVPKTLMNNVTKLKKQGLLEAEETTFQLTAKGVEKIGSMIIETTTNKEAQEEIKKGLKPGLVRLFELLLDGKEHQKEDIARKLGFAQGRKQKTFMNQMGELKGANIVFYPTKDTVQLVKETCFPNDC